MKKIFTLLFLLALVCVKGWGQTTQTFSYTGANQTFTVPAGVSSISVKLWGGGGAGSNTGGSGGSGALVKGTISVTPGQVLTIVVGGQGVPGSTSAPYGGGGASGGGSSTGGGSGGGYSGIFNTATVSQANALGIAGGGGGGGYYNAPTYGGGGGATTGSNGGNAFSTYTGGTGGSTSAGGAGAIYNNASGRSNPGLALTGGSANTAYTYYGGGGGGGYYGGGSGYSSNSATYYSSGGGGGSSYLGTMTTTTNTAGTTDAVSQTGNTIQAPGSSETGYVAGVGNGGSGNSGSSGGNGLVYISYTVVSAPPTIISFTPTTVCSNGGTSVTITGTNFTGATAVKFNGVNATSFTVTNATTITAVSPNAATAGTITVTTPGGTATSAGSFTVTPAPVITTQPASTTVCVGGSFTLSVVASNATGYQWQKGGVSITGATSSTYTVASAATTDAGNYTVIVSGTSPCATVTSSPAATVTVNTPAAIGTNPSSTTVCSNTSASFTASASGAGVTTVWQVSPDGTTWTSLTNTAPYSGVTTGTLSISNTSGLTGNQYRLSATAASPCSNTPVNSTAATLTVIPAPVITTQPASTTVCVGGSFTLSVVASNATGYQWQKGGVSISGATNATYTVAAASAGDAGSYTVIVSGASPCATVTSTPAATVTVNTPAAITTNPTSQTVCSNTAVTFTGAASGTGVTYQWQLSTDNGATFNNITNTGVYTGATTATLSISNPTGLTGNQYRLSATAASPCSNTVNSTAATLTVTPAPVITTQPTSQTVCVGGSFTLSVVASNAATYQWRRGTTNIAGATSPTYTVASASAGDAGTTYNVVITGNSPCASVTSSPNVSVTVNTPAAISTNPASKAVCSNTTPVTFTASASGTSVTTVWQVSTDGTTWTSLTNTAPYSGVTTGTLSISNTSGLTGNQYRLSATAASPCSNTVNSTAATLTVTPQPAATISYSGSPFCNTVSPVTPTFSGTTGGTFTSTAGLTIDGSTGTITPATSTAGSYTITYTVAAAGGCSTYTTTAGVTINPPAPTSVSVTPSSVTACSGASTTLRASATTSASKIATGSDDFNGTPTYTIGGSGTSGAGYYQIWSQVSSPYSSSRTQGLGSISSPDNSKFMLAWVNAYNSATVNSTLTSPVINTTNYASLSLSFQYAYKQTSTGVFTIEASTDGTNYTTIKSYTTTSTGYPSFTTDNINLNSYIKNSTVYIRFHANLSNTFTGPGAYLGLDNVTLNGAAIPFFSWTASPPATAGLPSGAGTFSTANSSISVQPTATTVYTLTAQDPATGCNGTSTATSTVTVNPLPIPTFTTSPASQVCGKTDVTYTTQGGQSHYTWSGFGTPGTDYTITSGSLSATSNTVTVQWLTAGSHTVTVNYSNSSNCSGATPATSTTTVLAYPTAYTVTGGGAYCSNDGGQTGSGQTISLSGSETGVTYTLYLNGSPTTATQQGTTGSTLNFTSVLAPGTYTIFAMNTTTNCTQMMTGSATITVNAFPNDYAVSASGTPVNNTGITYTNCGTASIYLSGSDANTTYTLKHGSTIVTTLSGTGSALTFTVSQVGRFTYSITAANSSCQNGMGSVDVTVYALPTPTFTSAPTGTACQNTSVTYTTQSGQFSYAWTVSGTAETDYHITSGGIGSTDNTVTLTWLTSGNKTVTVNYNNSNGCTGASAATSTITVNPNATIALTSGTGTDAQTVCAGITISPITYSIGGGGTNASATGLPSGISGTYSNGVFTISGSATVTTATTYHYTVTTTGTCTQTSAAGTITINPNATITLTSGTGTDGQSICSGNSITDITYSISGGGTNATVSNTLPAGVTGSYTNGVFTITGTPTQTGTFSYTVTTTGICAQTTATGSITINQTPAATVAAATPSSVCAGTSVQVTFTGTPGAVVSYTINGGTVQTVTIGSGGNVSVNSSSNANTYTYTITGITLGSCSGTTGAANQSTTVTVNAYPIATISVNPGTGYVQIGNTVQLTAGTGGGTWTSNNTPVATVGNTSGTVTGVTSGTATIGYSITTNGCSSSSSQLITVTADFITKQAGNFSDFHTWNIGTPNGVSPSSSPIPTSTSTVEVEHALTLDQSFSVGAGKNLNIGTGGTMEIAPNVMFISLGTVAFNGNHVTVRSTALGTGAIGYMENPIVGASNVTVERYIPLTTTNGSAGRTGRAWRLLTSPVTGMTIKDAWQEGATGVTNNPNPGYGTIITGQGIPGSTASSTFDYIASGGHNASILQYNPGTTTGIWQVPDVNNTTGTNTAVSSQPAWFLFVRGDRTANTSTAKGTTTLRATGTLNQGDQPPINIPVKNAYTLVGNPFASPIDFEQIYQNSQIAPQFFTWNSKNGVYGSYTLTIRNGVNDYTTVPDYQISSTGTADANARYIMSSEGFFVQPATTLSDGTLVIPRASKNAGDATVGINPYRVSASTEGRLFINLNLAGSTTDTAAVLADGVMARFDKSYASAIDGDDIRKQSNFNENLGIESNSTSLMVEARPEVQKTDTLQLKLWNVTRRSYQLQLKGANFAQAAAQKGLHAYLEDSYLKTKQEISLSGSVTTIAFSVTSDALSYDSHRFRVVFESDASSILPITLTQVKAQLQNSGVSVSWSTQNEVNVRKYTVERSVNGGSTFSGIATATAKNLGATTPLSSYETFDAAPVKGDNLYRIRVEGVDGKVTYTGVVKVTVGEDASGKTLITLYPNPVSRREGKAWLNLKNVKAGDYLLSVYSESGQNIMEKKITVATGSRSQTESLSLPSSLAQGSYQLQLTNSNGIKVFTSKLIIGK